MALVVQKTLYARNLLIFITLIGVRRNFFLWVLYTLTFSRNQWPWPLLLHVDRNVSSGHANAVLQPSAPSGRRSPRFDARTRTRGRVLRRALVEGLVMLFYFGAMPFVVSSLIACSFFDRWVNPMPCSTLGALVNWMFS
jgi:hypothetical protein